MKLRVLEEENSYEIPFLQGCTLLAALQEAEVCVDSACGGNGTCLKCRVCVNSGFAGVSAIDRKVFTDQELQEGWRLSCQLRPKTSLEVRVPKTESIRKHPRLVIHSEVRDKPLRLVCDMGSTGVVVALGHDYQNRIAEAHLLNRQVRYGFDVMTRMQAVQKWGMEPLQKTLHESILKCVAAIKDALPEACKSAFQSPMFCAGNSAIVSFLHGWDTSTLATSPFQPVKREGEKRMLKGVSLEIEVETLPLLAGFVGADTVAGIVYLEHLQAPTPWMLVDIGTNTEIVLKTTKGHCFFASAPAGPAFEGGNITKGMRAEPGAVSRAYFKGSWYLETVGNDIPRGLCGSGLIDVIHEAVNHGWISKDGFLPDGKLELSERVFLLADDIREFQLAKSATRTAIDVVIDRGGEKPLQIYMAGAFAEHLREEAIKNLGLLPENIPMKAIGNASLLGTFLYAGMGEEERERFCSELEANRYPIELALQDDFQHLFVQNLNF